MRSEQEARDTLAPYAVLLAECWASAQMDFDEFKSSFPKWHLLTTRTLAGMFHDLLANAITRKFMYIPEAQVTRKYGRVGLILCGRFYIRFKKLDKNYRPSYTRTKSAVDCFELQHSLEEAGSSVTNLINGYVPGPFGNIAQTVITCPYAQDNLYMMALTDLMDDGQMDLGVVANPPKPPVLSPKTEALPVAPKVAEDSDAG